MSDKFADDVIEELLERLAKGEGLVAICKDRRMPDRRTVQRWTRSDDDLGARVHEAREAGFHALAEKAITDAESCTDPIKGRLVFDARRWYLGKLSQAFADKPIAIGAVLNVDRDDAFAVVTGALEKAATAIASQRDRTITVAADSTTGSDHSAGRLADMAGDGGEGLR